MQSKFNRRHSSFSSAPLVYFKEMNIRTLFSICPLTHLFSNLNQASFQIEPADGPVKCQTGNLCDN